MNLNLALYLWILLPSALFVVLAGYMVIIGRGPGGEKFKAWKKAGRRPAVGRRPGMLVNLVSRDGAADATRSVPSEVVIEAASRVALGSRQHQAR